MIKPSEYALAGVNYQEIEPFKRAMIAVGKRTLKFPQRRGVFINESVIHGHGAVFEYCGPHQLDHMWCGTKEGLGNKNWITEWMYQFGGSSMDMRLFGDVMIDNILMAVNDVIAQGAMPVEYKDEVAAGDSEWFGDTKRAEAIAEGAYRICEQIGMALPAGESPSLRYLIKAEPPVKSAPVMSGHVIGIVAPKRHLITGQKLQLGDHIIAVTSSGLHANGVSLVIKRALTLPDQFLTKLPTGRNLGQEALIPTRSYVALVEALLNAEIDIHVLLPATGDGVGKLAFDDRPYTYRIFPDLWVPVPPLFQFMRELGVSIKDCLKTWNWGAGYYIFVPPNAVYATIDVGTKAGYELADVGVVKEGPRQVIFGPEHDLVLPPPGS